MLIAKCMSCPVCESPQHNDGAEKGFGTIRELTGQSSAEQGIFEVQVGRSIISRSCRYSGTGAGKKGDLLKYNYHLTAGGADGQQEWSE